MAHLAAVVGKDTPLGKMLNDLYNPGRKQGVFHNLNDLRPKGPREAKTEWGVTRADAAAKAKRERQAAVVAPKLGRAPVEPAAAPFRPSIKTQQQIMAENPYEPEQYRPTALPRQDKNGKLVVRGGEAEKARLARQLAKGGGDGPGDDADDGPSVAAGPGRGRARRPFRAEREPEKVTLDPATELTKQLLAEIREREEFLAEMKALGQEKEIELPIKAEIAERIRRLREIEKKGK